MSSMGDNIEPSDHDFETPMAEHLAVGGPARSLSTPPSRSNSPAAGSPESTTAGLGALQVLSSPDIGHDETWNTFLDVRPSVACTPSSIITFTRLLLTSHLDFPETFRRKQGLKGTSIAEPHTRSCAASPFTLVACRSPPPHLYNCQCPDAYYTGTLHKRTLEPLEGFQADQHHCACHRVMFKARCMTYLSQLEAAEGFLLSDVSDVSDISLLPPDTSMSECTFLAADASRCAKHTLYPWTASTTVHPTTHA